MGVAHGGIRLRTAARAIYIIQNQMCHSSSKKAREGWRTPCGLPTGVFAQSGLGLIADPILTSLH